MKTNITLCFLLLCLLSQHRSNAQGNFPFPTANAEWVIYRVNPIIGPTDYFYVYRYYLKGDSMFLGKTYSQIYSQSLCYCECPNQTHYFPSTSHQPYLIGGVREEHGKVYFTKFGTGTGQEYFSPLTDTLLFDFTAQVGDTIDYANQLKLVITEVDTNFEGRKEIHFKRYPPDFGVQDSWVEGKGWMDHLNMTESDWLYTNGGCFSDQAPSSCPIPCTLTSTNDPNSLSGIRINPTLVSDYVEFTYADPVEKYDLKIFSVEGKLLGSYKSIISSDRINIGHLPSGILIFQLQGSKGAIGVSKVVKIE